MPKEASGQHTIKVGGADDGGGGTLEDARMSTPIL